MIERLLTWMVGRLVPFLVICAGLAYGGVLVSRLFLTDFPGASTPPDKSRASTAGTEALKASEGLAPSEVDQKSVAGGKVQPNTAADAERADQVAQPTKERAATQEDGNGSNRKAANTIPNLTPQRKTSQPRPQTGMSPLRRKATRPAALTAPRQKGFKCGDGRIVKKSTNCKAGRTAGTEGGATPQLYRCGDGSMIDEPYLCKSR